LDRFLDGILGLLGRRERRDWASFYVEGLLSDLNRKNAATVASRSPSVDSQSVQQLLHSSPWDPLPVRRALTQMAVATLSQADVWIIDDTGFPKKGKHSVGVARQYSGILGKVDNCQVAVSLHYATHAASFPMDWALYLPEEWANDPERRRKARVPDEVVFRTKGELALDLVDRALAMDIPAGVVVADAAYGKGHAFRQGLDERGLQYVVGSEGSLTFWRDATVRQTVPYQGHGRPRKSPRYDDQKPPESAQVIAHSLPEEAWEEITYAQGTKKPLKGRFVALRVQPAYHSYRREGEQPMRWLLLQKLDDPLQPFKYFLSNLKETTPLWQLVRIGKLRWRIEQDYQILKGQLGLDHYEGRTWTGWHHHVTLAMIAFHFLLSERLRGEFPPSDLTGNPPADPKGTPP
jgi:SRSO17 transposase